jgi:hypothetical protein
LVEYSDHKSGAKAEQYAKFVPPKDWNIQDMGPPMKR